MADPEEHDRDVDGRFAPKVNESVKTTRKKGKPRGRPFKKGEKRSPKAGRKKGTPNKATTAWKDFVRMAVEDPEQQEALLKRMMARPELLFRAAEHAVGKPKETVSMDVDAAISYKWGDE